MADAITIPSPAAAALIEIHVSYGEQVLKGAKIATLESMKVQIPVTAPASGRVAALNAAVGQTLQKGAAICTLTPIKVEMPERVTEHSDDSRDQILSAYRERLHHTLDEGRETDVAKRHKRGYRTARENLTDLCDPDTFVEYGQLAVAAQRGRRAYDELKSRTAADGIITGFANINAQAFPDAVSQTAVIVNDYSVLAGTQGYFHHQKLDRILEIAKAKQLPVIMYTEGGGGRPGDTDVAVQIAGLHLTSFAAWAALSGQVPRIAVNNGYCFAGNAALFGCADITIATRNSWIGMAGPAMIEGGGLGVFQPTDIGPVDVQSKNGVIDLVADDEADATRQARKILSYFQGCTEQWSCADQSALWKLLPADRRYVYDIRKIIETLVDTDSFVELRRDFGGGIITGFIRIEGRPFGLLANDCRVLGGAIDAEAADKTARFINLCNDFKIPLVSLCDTPGFMVGPESETQAAVRRMSDLFIAGARCTVPIVAIFLRKGYGLGAMAMAGGSFAKPLYCAAWPSGEFGGMGLEAAVRLGFKKELAAAASDTERQALYDQLVAQAYDRGQATEAAAFLELDGVIDPAETRALILHAMSGVH